MSKGDVFENDLLKLIFHGLPIVGIADNAAAAPLTSLVISLHTADPGEGGTQLTNECTYGGYARVQLLRSAAGWSVAGNLVQPVANIDFPTASSGSETVTFAAVGTAASGAGKILYKGPVTPSIAIAVGTTPRLTVASQGSEE